VIRNVAVVVGASTYKDISFFSGLPGAARDAIWISRFLENRGLPVEEAHVLIGEAANREAILQTFRLLSSEPAVDDLRLFFFFSGHGTVVDERGKPRESVLICHDTEYANPLETGLTIAALVSALQRVQASQVYLFIDACFMSIADISRSLALLPDVELFRRIRDIRTFFSVIANEQGLAFEGRRSRMGELTSNVLNSIEKVDSSPDRSLARLTEEIQVSAASHSDGNPNVLVFGSLAHWPFASLENDWESKAQRATDKTEIERRNLVDKVLAALRSRRAPVVTVIGPAGIGKTTLLGQVRGRVRDCIFIRVESSKQKADFPALARLIASELYQLLGENSDPISLALKRKSQRNRTVRTNGSNPHDWCFRSANSPFPGLGAPMPRNDE
jgi:hypothetical protein